MDRLYIIIAVLGVTVAVFLYFDRTKRKEGKTDKLDKHFQFRSFLAILVVASLIITLFIRIIGS